MLYATALPSVTYKQKKKLNTAIRQSFSFVVARAQESGIEKKAQNTDL